MAKKTKNIEPLAPVTEIDPEARKMMLKKALTDISKRYGEGSIMRLGEAKQMEVEAISTGSLGLDLALGVGGVPRGRITEIYGPESSGKTTICLHIVAEAQKKGGTAAFIDMEHALDPVYAHKLGVDINELLVSQPDTGEQALEICETLVRSGAVDVIIVDSVAALVPRAEIEGSMGDASMGMQARLISQAMRKLSGIINQTKTAVIFTNQLRQKIGVMFGNPETTTGGLAMKFYASVRMDVRRTQTIKKNNEVIGGHTRVRVVKNKVAPPFAVAEFDLMHDQGINKTAEVLDMAAELDIVKKRGAFYSYQDLKLGQGRDKSIEFLNTNPELRDEIEAKIREFAKDSDTPLLQFTAEEEDDDDDLKAPGSALDLDVDDDDDDDVDDDDL
ncbi:MAG: recombinase RecA [Anaerolineaceae bacterium]|nr:recombinase RecA [Anaerolineaceae bacterium]